MSILKTKERSLEEWLNTLPQELLKTIPKYYHMKKPLLSQINYILLTNILNNKVELNPKTEEVLQWVKTGQISTIKYNDPRLRKTRFY